jgi:phosphatidylserine/phosphatidylglycerophosphate/cardiolipin synthase-like enzyme
MVIDGNIAFMGGLDITYSRYDTCDHPLFDYNNNLFPGIEYTNERKQMVKNVSEYTKHHLNRDIPRMPWHDIGVRLYGEVVWDFATHFIQYWNYAICNMKLKNAGSSDEHDHCCQKTIVGIRQGSFYIKDVFKRMYRKCFPAKDPRRYGRYI